MTGTTPANGAPVAAVTAGATAAPPLIDAARRDAPTAERRRLLTPEVADAVARAGFPRHFVPRELGGSAGEFAPLVREAAVLAETCAATAWCATLYAAHGRLAAYLPPDGQAEVWADGPDARISAAVVPPQGRAEAVAGGGWRLTGDWRPASGVDHARWVLLASWTPGPTGREHRIFAVPRAETTVRDTWHASGLRGTGSNTVTADGVLVPGRRSFTLDALSRPRPGGARCHRVPFPMVASLLFAAPLLGIARGALRVWTEERRGAAVRHPATHTVLADASTRIRCAELLLDGAARRADAGDTGAAVVAENRRDAATAGVMCREAVDLLFRTAGLAAQTAQSPLQRAWRDATAVAGHATLDPDGAGRAYAEAVLGGG